MISTTSLWNRRVSQWSEQESVLSIDTKSPQSSSLASLPPRGNEVLRHPTSLGRVLLQEATGRNQSRPTNCKRPHTACWAQGSSSPRSAIPPNCRKVHLQDSQTEPQMQVVRVTVMNNRLLRRKQGHSLKWCHRWAQESVVCYGLDMGVKKRPLLLCWQHCPRINFSDIFWQTFQAYSSSCSVSLLKLFSDTGLQ